MSVLIKTAGLCLLFLSCALVGVSSSKALHERVRALSELIRMLEALRDELGYNQTAVRQALIRVNNLADGCAHCFLRDVEQGISQGLTPPESWHKAAMSVVGADAGDRAELASLANSLGASDLEGQKSAIGSCIRSLEGRQIKAREKSEQFSRLYRTLGILAGAAAVVIVL